MLSPAVLRDLRAAFERAADEPVIACCERGTIDGNMVFNAFGPQNERLAAAMVEVQRVLGWITAACDRDALTAGLDTTVNYVSSAARIA